MEGSPPTDSTSVSRGDVIGRKYVVDRVIGDGSAGVVVAAHHKDLRTKAAIKIGRTSDRESSARFQREAHAMARLESPYTVRVFDVGETPDGRPFMVMEHLDGRDLGTMLAEQGPLPVEDTLRWMLQASEALEEAHDVGILHRDVEPQRLFLASESLGSPAPPTIRVLDFGFAPLCSGLLGRIKSGEARSLQPGDIAGTSYFMAPEQIRGARLDKRTDVWGLGATLFRLLTDRYPFSGTDLAEVCEKILDDAPADIRANGRDIPRSVEAAVLRCLRKQPRDRFENMAALRTALREARDEMRNTPMVVAIGPRAQRADVEQRVSEAPPTPIVPAKRALLDELRPTPKGQIEAAPPSSDSMTRVVGPAFLDGDPTTAFRALADPPDEVTIQRGDPASSDTAITITEPDTIVQKGSGRKPKRLALGSPVDTAPTEVIRRDTPAPTAAAPRESARSVPLEKLVESVPVRLRARANVAKRPARVGEMPPSPFARTAVPPDTNDVTEVTPEPAEIVDIVERRHVEASEPSLEIPISEKTSDRPSPVGARDVVAPDGELPAARAPMHALHDYQPPRTRKAAAAVGVVALAAVAVGASAWVLHGRQPQAEGASPPSVTSSPTASSPRAAARAGGEPASARAGGEPAPPVSAAGVRSSETSSLAAASGSASDSAKTAAPPTSEPPATASAVSAATASEPPKTAPSPSPRPRVVRATPPPAPAAAPPTSRETETDSWSTSRGGSTPASTGTSSILDKRK